MVCVTESPELEVRMTNGIAMCKVHHAAFDSSFLGVRPDYRIEVRPDLLIEVDGPTLTYAIQGLKGQTIALPRRRSAGPDRLLLEERYEHFRIAG